MHEKVNGLGAALDPADGPLLSAPDAADVVDADVPSDVPSDAADDAPARARAVAMRLESEFASAPLTASAAAASLA